MKEGWEYKIFESCLVKVPKQVQIKSKDYKKEGKFPIVSQEAELISGYWDDETIVYKHKEPVVIFGDHTKNIKYVDFNFVVGADGTHILSTKKDINPKFFYYVLKSIKLRELGYARHYKLLKEKYIPVPPLSEQQSIVEYLDSSFAKIDAMKANAEKALNEAKALFQASLKEMLEPKEGWEEKKLGDICSDIRYGTSTPSNENGEYKYLRMNNITNDGFLDVSHYKTISLPEKELEKCLVKRGDIIFNRTNSRELVGKSCVFTEDENMVIAGYLIRIRLKEGFEPQFITYSMNLQRSLGLFQHLIVGAVHQANISANNIQKVIINYPPLSEQQSIVATLDSLKSKVDKLQANYEKISQECDALKQAILRQVFE